MKIARLIILCLVAGFAVLSIPLSDPAIPTTDQALPFVWNQDSTWTALEELFVESRANGCGDVGVEIDARLGALDGYLSQLDSIRTKPTDLIWDEVEKLLFVLGAQVAACPSAASRYITSATELRQIAKEQSQTWDIESVETRRRLYRLLYGSRAAIEEVLSQQPDTSGALIRSSEIPQASGAAIPSAVVRGVRIYSGDILVSRGGYPTSALISRGSDYPGNFSHVAIAYVSDTGEVSIVEAHIEVGVAVASAEKYLADKKLRLMLLRLRPDLPQVVANPRLPHLAAGYALLRAQSGHVPYDFEMDYKDPSRLFCSEVASDAYGEFGVDLWAGISRISNPGLRSWLAAFGVRHFETQEPSDLEYDPQLFVAAEWRDPETLRMDRIDNAVVDAMLETAENGESLTYNWYELAPGRLAKGYSMILNQLWRVGPVPQGMGAASALRNRSYTERHDRYAERVDESAIRFLEENGYEPPYWALVEIARQAVSTD